MTREEVSATPRGSMSPARRRRILTRDGNICAHRGCEVAEGLEVDHIVCLELGGRDTDDNCEGLCGPHHKKKTARDAKLIAKARRLRKARLGQNSPKPKMQSRGFDKRFHHHMNGTRTRRTAKEQGR